VRAAVAAEEKELPIEVRALHTLLAQDAFEALLLSEQVAERALARGDAQGAVIWLHRGLDLAGPSDSDRARVLRELASVAHERDRSGEALGYLREALEIASTSGSHDLVASLEDMRRAWAS